MSSTNKTANLKLNSWAGTDIPKREDFNRDNSIIDSAVTQHVSDTVMHTTEHEKKRWNNPYYIGTYYGTGALNRTIDIPADFSPTWGILFAVNNPPSASDYRNSANYNYFAVLSDKGSTAGVELNNRQITVMQSTIAVLGNEYRNFNENGLTYVYIVFQ